MSFDSLIKNHTEALKANTDALNRFAASLGHAAPPTAATVAAPPAAVAPPAPPLAAPPAAVAPPAPPAGEMTTERAMQRVQEIFQSLATKYQHDVNAGTIVAQRINEISAWFMVQKLSDVPPQYSIVLANMLERLVAADNTGGIAQAQTADLGFNDPDMVALRNTMAPPAYAPPAYAPPVAPPAYAPPVAPPGPPNPM